MGKFNFLQHWTGLGFLNRSRFLGLGHRVRHDSGSQDHSCQQPRQPKRKSSGFDGRLLPLYRQRLTPLLVGGLLASCAGAEVSKKEYTASEKAIMLLKIANGALLEGDPTGALENAIAAERFDSSLAEIYHTKSLAFFAKRDLESAIHEVQHALELRPQFSEASNTLGKLLVDAGRWQAAVAPLTLAAKDPLFRDAYKAYTNLGILKFKQRQFMEAETYFNQAINASSQRSCVARYYRGQLAAQDSRMREAISDFLKATQKNCSKFADAHLALGQSYQKTKQYDLARKTFLEMQSLYPNSTWAEQALNDLKLLP